MITFMTLSFIDCFIAYFFHLSSFATKAPTVESLILSGLWTLVLPVIMGDLIRSSDDEFEFSARAWDKGHTISIARMKHYSFQPSDLI
jgi:hypothetical protein